MATGWSRPALGGHKGIEGARVPAALHLGSGEESLGPGPAFEFLAAVELGVGDDENITELSGCPDTTGGSGGDDQLWPRFAHYLLP